MSQVSDAAAKGRIPWKLDKGRKAGELGYLPGLDGLRAIAVLGVLLYHADFDWMPGGFLGVDIFFVLSGFLITSLILEQLDRTGRVNFKQFYLGRARRLLPALLLMLAVVSIAAAAVYRDVAQQVGRDALASVFYLNNWSYIFQNQSYFEFIGRPPLLKHLWSLAVEEQFYLIWPVVAFLVMRRFRRRGVLVVAVALALASTAWMAVLAVGNGFPDYADPSRAYFGTDSHCMGLLVGAALATFWRPGRLPTKVSPAAKGAMLTAGIALLVVVLWFLGFVGEFTPWLYRGGFLVLAVIVAALIAMATHPALPLGIWLGTQPLRYIGQRSYGLYLWHWPIFMVTRPGLDTPLDGIPNLLLQFGLTFGIAELSFRYVEMPIRRGAIGRWWKRADALTGAQRRRAMGAVAGTALAAAAAIALVAGLLATAPKPDPGAGMASDVASALGLANGGPTEVAIDDPEPAASGERPDGGQSEAPAKSNGTLSAIGDSVMLGARSTLVDVIPGAKVDAAVSRFPGAFIGRIKKLTAKDKLAPVVVLHPGTNGVMPEDMLREMLDLLADRERVIVVNDSMPRSWRAPNNKVMAKVVPDYPNAVLVDWYAASKGRDDYFVSDGVHLTSKGARAYAKLIKNAAELPTNP